ncbi:hypothetical protein BX600DRAFT_296113 [Xylariales sp. PMI_506]|nr:hypothetical protein BX600DRAFT_296113 [Xylariales sp. PMI_506]
MSSPVMPPLRRLNGRLQACDPCRSRKVACDHTQPVCLRCKKKKKDRHCVYTISSRSVTGTTEESTASPTTRIKETETSESSLSTSPGDIRSTIANGRPNRPPDARANATGYLGYTSYCTVIDETLSMLAGEPPDYTTCMALDGRPIQISQKTLELGVTILHHIPSADYGKLLFQREFTAYDSWVQKIAGRFLDSIYETFGEYLGADRTLAKYEEMARRICYNSSRPVIELREADAWLDQFCGPNLRWESIGLLFHHWDTGQVPESQKYPRPREVTQECLILCVELSQEFSDGNIFLVYLKSRLATHESMISGDASRQTWRYHADTISSLTFLGMHAQGSGHNKYEPTLFSETSRRILAIAIVLDKVTVAFTGRPPLLSQKFVTTPMPLDLKDDYLFLGYEARMHKVRTTLDERGWNTEGGLYSSTYIRARFMLAKISEDIAVIALGTDSATSIQDIHLLKGKLAAVVSEFPSVLQWRPDDLTNHTVKFHVVYTRLLLKLNIVQNEFFLERILSRKGATDGEALLAASFELVSLVLNLWTHMDKFRKEHKDFEWVLVGYGAPGGGILCKWLLESRSSMLGPNQPHITRSAVTQKLSLLVGFLDWVGPRAPNAELCQEIKLVIQRVLDQALNTTTPNDTIMLAGMDWDFGGQVDFNFDLMDTFDWLRTDTTS